MQLFIEDRRQTNPKCNPNSECTQSGTEICGQVYQKANRDKVDKS